MTLLLGAVADDFTGATDLASMLSRGGMRTLLVLGAPAPTDPVPDVEAIVVALKSRTAPVSEAVADSLAAWRWARSGGARRCYFKYCSTFDSTPQGNIGPVAAALMAETGASRTTYCPALPENGRSVYQGHLFVGDRLLSETGMRDHPLTPMRDSDLRRLLAPQLPEGARIGLADARIVDAGPMALADRLDALEAEGVAHIVVDACVDRHLAALAEAVAEDPLVTAGSGLGLALPGAYERRGWIEGGSAQALPRVGGPILMLSGSCSVATNAQVAAWERAGGATLRLDPIVLAERADPAAEPFEWAAARLPEGPVLIAATQAPERLAETQAALGRERAAELVEATLSEVARRAAASGVRRFVAAGGETSGAVAQALGAARLAVGPSIAPGVPWCATEMDGEGAPTRALALKSGNFGAESFFADAVATAP